MRCAQIHEGKVINIILAGRPEDFNAVECDNDVRVGWFYRNGKFIKPETSSSSLFLKTGDDVNVERDRRIIAGTVIIVTGHGGVPVTGTKDDKDVFLARRIVAAEAAANGISAPVFVFRDRENVNHNLTPSQMVELADKGFAWIEAMMVRSWQMKDGVTPYEAGIPDNLDDDSHWPKPKDD